MGFCEILKGEEDTLQRILFPFFGYLSLESSDPQRCFVFWLSAPWAGLPPGHPGA